MRRRGLAALGAALLWLPVADNLPAAQPRGADWSRQSRVEAGGIRAYYPQTWTASVEDTTIVIRSGSTRVMLIDYGTTPEYFPPRPDRFQLDDRDRRFLSCLGSEGWNVIFRDRGQSVQAFVRLGSGTRKSDVVEVLDRLIVD